MFFIMSTMSEMKINNFIFETRSVAYIVRYLNILMYTFEIIKKYHLLFFLLQFNQTNVNIETFSLI